MKINNELAAEMANTSDAYAPKPLITRHPAVVVECREHTSQKNPGGPAMHLMVLRLEGGKLNGTELRDYQGVNHPNNVVRNIAARRLKLALTATGCMDAADTTAMTGKRLLVTTKSRIDKRDGSTQIDIDRYDRDDGNGQVETAAHQPAQNGGPSLPPFMQQQK